MDSITHRELRNNSAEILRRVEVGETLQVTDNGKPAWRGATQSRSTDSVADKLGGLHLRKLHSR